MTDLSGFPSSVQQTVLVVEDDNAVRTSLQRALGLEGYSVEVANDAEEGISRLRANPPDAIVLDIMLPGMDGVTFCTLLRSKGDWTPILMLTARDAVEDRVRGLDAGADDYLVKPFALSELLARLRSLLRRNGDPEEGILRFGDLALDRSRFVAMRSTREFNLTRTEFSLLELLMNHPRQVLTREVILERVWGFDSQSTSNSLEVYIGNLRRKTEGGGEPRLIHTIWGVGYALRTERSREPAGK